MSNMFGPIITAGAVRQAIQDTIEKWMPDYLSEVGLRNGFDRGELPVFQSYAPMIVWDKFEEDQVPSCLIVAPGTLDVPQRRGGKMNVRWGVGIGCVVSGQDREGTWKLGEIYAAAVRTLLLQHQSLGGFATGINWISERYDQLPSDSARTLGAGSLQFGVDVDGVTDPGQGLMVPTFDPLSDAGDWPEVDTVSFDVTPRS